MKAGRVNQLRRFVAAAGIAEISLLCGSRFETNSEAVELLTGNSRAVLDQQVRSASGRRFV